MTINLRALLSFKFLFAALLALVACLRADLTLGSLVGSGGWGALAVLAVAVYAVLSDAQPSPPKP